jgi:hypothetical protein
MDLTSISDHADAAALPNGFGGLRTFAAVSSDDRSADKVALHCRSPNVGF